MKVVFNRPHVVGTEFKYIQDAINYGQLSGNGPFSKWCAEWFVKNLRTKHALMTHSCTAAIEMAAILCDIKAGDEVIMPSFTFVSTANAFVLRGAVPVFVDIRPDTLNLDERLLEQAITPKTKAIVPVHYAGVPCEMDRIMEIARAHKLWVIEDAAQGIHAQYKNRALGSIGDIGCLSFHETKNIISGEGGALLINNSDLIERSEIIWEKGTNRSQFFKGHVDKYTWVDVGSSFLPSEITSAFLRAQLENIEGISQKRADIWRQYHQAFEALEEDGALRRPQIPDNCVHNAHLYYLLLPSSEQRDALLKHLNQNGIHAVFHYLPLDLSPAGKQFAISRGSMSVTHQVSASLLRLPLWPDLTEEQIKAVIETTYSFFRQ